MKKSVFIKIGAIVAASLILPSMIALLMYRPKPMHPPEFKFLSGRDSFVRIKEDSSKIKQTRFVFSFKADYNDIHADAESELLALGYQPILYASQPFFPEYRLKGRKPDDSISVRFIENYKLIDRSQEPDSDYISPVQVEYQRNDGWVSIQITQTRGRNRLFVIIKQFFQKLRGAKYKIEFQ